MAAAIVRWLGTPFAWCNRSRNSSQTRTGPTAGQSERLIAAPRPTAQPSRRISRRSHPRTTTRRLDPDRDRTTREINSVAAVSSPATDAATSSTVIH
jgi:hypothetical protein